jgi:hypothetical protein
LKIISDVYEFLYSQKKLCFTYIIFDMGMGHILGDVFRNLRAIQAVRELLLLGLATGERSPREFRPPIFDQIFYYK